MFSPIKFNPHELLQDCIQGYWVHEESHWFLNQDFGLVFHPEAFAQLKFWTLPDQFGKDNFKFGASFIGVQITPIKIIQEPRLVLGVRFYPWGVKRLLGLEPVNTNNTWKSITLSFTKDICKLLHAKKFEPAIQMLDAWLLERHQSVLIEPSVGVAAGRELFASNGLMQITDLAEIVNVSVRSVERGFQKELGINAKLLARLLRFEQVHDSIIESPKVNYSELAFDLGFADQSHLIREFRVFAAQTPNEFARGVQVYQALANSDFSV